MAEVNLSNIKTDWDAAFVEAVKEGDLLKVQAAIAAGADIHHCEGCALKFAAGNGHLEILQYLLESGVDVHAQEDAALSEAIMNGQSRIVSCLVDAGADIHEGDESALSTAIIFGELEIIKLLVDAGADVNAGIKLVEAVNGGRLDIVQYLVQKGADVRYLNDFSLRSAVEHGHREIIEFLVQSGSGLNEGLLAAAGSGKNDLIDYLIELGAELEKCEVEAVMEAANRRELDSLKYLIELGANFRDEKEFKNAVRSPGLDSCVANFLEIASSIIPENHADRSNKELAKEVSSRLGLSTEEGIALFHANAFGVKSTPWTQTPFVVVALETAALVCSLGVPEYSKTEGFFEKVFREERSWIANQKGISWNQYAAELQNFKYENTSLADVRDLVHEVRDSILLPVKSFELEDPRSASRNALSVIRREGVVDAAELVIDGKTTLELKRLNRRWHRTDVSMPTQLRPLRWIGEWEPLIDPVELGGGVGMLALTTPQQLADEGRNLSHCVGEGGYVTSCQHGETHILSVHDRGTSLATIELSEGGDELIHFNGARFGLQQFLGEKNSEPSQKARGAFEQFSKLFAQGVIAINPMRGETSASKRNRENLQISEIEQAMGMYLDDRTSCLKGILDYYERKMTLPGTRTRDPKPLLPSTFRDFIGKRLKEVEPTIQ